MLQTNVHICKPQYYPTLYFVWSETVWESISHVVQTGLKHVPWPFLGSINNAMAGLDWNKTHQCIHMINTIHEWPFMTSKMHIWIQYIITYIYIYNIYVQRVEWALPLPTNSRWLDCNMLKDKPKRTSGREEDSCYLFSLWKIFWDL